MEVLLLRLDVASQKQNSCTPFDKCVDCLKVANLKRQKLDVSRMSCLRQYAIPQKKRATNILGEETRDVESGRQAAPDEKDNATNTTRTNDLPRLLYCGWSMRTTTPIALQSTINYDLVYCVKLLRSIRVH